MRRARAPVLADDGDFAKLVGREGGACVDAHRRRVGGLPCDVAVWQHAHHVVVELVDVSAEGHHRPSLEALHAADAGAETTFAERGSAYHAVGVDLSFHDVGKACMRPADVAKLYGAVVDAVAFEGDARAGPASRRRAVKARSLDGDDAPRAADFDLRAALPQPLDARATASSVRAAAASRARRRARRARCAYGARGARRVLRVFHRQFLDAGRPSRSLLRARHAFLRVATEKRAALTVQCGQRRRLAMRVAEDRRWEHDAAKAAAKVACYASRACQARDAARHRFGCHEVAAELAYARALDAQEADPRASAALCREAAALAGKAAPNARAGLAGKAWLAAGRAHQLTQEFEKAREAYAACVRAAPGPGLEVDALVGEATIARRLQGAVASLPKFEACVARAAAAVEEGADSHRLLAAQASAWVNFATTILQTSTDDASLARAVDLLERSVDQRTRIIVEAGPSREAQRQLGLSYANLGLARIRADRNSEGRQYLEAAHKIAVDTRDAFLERMIRANANNNPEIGLRVDDLPGGRAADPRSDALCAICLDELAGKVVYETACAHAFCKGCIQSWIAHAPGAPTCPTCKAHLNIPRGR
ncbi:hypothetical protein JL722_8485 [Aureococcus anophagefferens]|nr:hypothetical protein JL722_8485 [Aureococcus anophagefferens]